MRKSQEKASKTVLRDYQEGAVDRLFDYWSKKIRPCILQLATGAGKSLIIAEIVRRAGVPVLVLQPSKEILEQNFEKIVEAGFDPHHISVCSASASSWQLGDLTLATIGTICKHAKLCERFKIIIVDEADCVPCDRVDSQYLKFFNAIPNPQVRIVGLTATPYRNQTFARMYQAPQVYCRPLTRIFCRDGEGTRYGRWFWGGGIIYKMGIDRLQERGFLSPTCYHMAETDWSFVRDVPGRVDYDTVGMEKWMDIEANTSRFTQAINWCMQQNLQTIIFSPNIDMNFRLKRVIEALGGTAECMDSDNDSKDSRAAKMEAFRAKDFQFLVNVGMVGRGVDVPSVDAVLLCRPTKSISLYQQFIGRCLRKDPNNPDKIAVVLDLAGNVQRFGKVEDIKLGKIRAKPGDDYSVDCVAIKTLEGKVVRWEQVS